MLFGCVGSGGGSINALQTGNADNHQIDSFTIEPGGSYHVGQHVLLFSHPTRDFYLPDIQECAHIPNRKVAASLSKPWQGHTLRMTMGMLAPLSWIYNNQHYFFGFPGNELERVLLKCRVVMDVIIVVSEYLGRPQLYLGDDITTLSRVQSFPHYHPSPPLTRCTCKLCVSS